MIAVLVLAYVGLLFLAAKMNLIKMTLFWKLSPIIWMVFLTIALFIPMQFWAPGGSVLIGQYSVQIVPNVGGEVIEVPVTPNVPLKKGDVLFKIDPVPYQAAVDDLTAQLDLAETRLGQAQRLAERGAGSVFDVEALTAQVAQVEAGLSNAHFNLENTVVRAPADGYVTNVALRVGARVVKVMPASALGQRAPSGFAAMPEQIVHAPMWVRLELEDPSLLPELRVGATGTGAIYTDFGAPTQIIRRVMIRMDAIINYLSPV